MKRLIVLSALVSLVASGAALAGSGARSTSGVIYASANHSEGKDLYVSGDFKDKILGRGAIVYITRVSTSGQPGTFVVTARKVTAYTSRGALTGTGKATQIVAADGTATVTDGSFKLTKGTQGMRGHRLTGTFGGTFADGVYTFKYKGKYR